MERQLGRMKNFVNIVDEKNLRIKTFSSLSHFRNKIKDNDLFTNPVDITDNNIPNGNSIYFSVINKLYDITENASLKEKLIKLSQSFHVFINTNFSQMFSYYKSLNIYE